MEIKEINVSKLLFNPADKDFISKLKVYEEFNGDYHGLDEKKVLTYIVLLYDFNSDLKTIITRLWPRKYEAAIIAGFKLVKQKNKNVFQKEVEEMIMGKYESINAMITRYLFLFDNPSYIAQMANMEILEKLSMCAHEPQGKPSDYNTIAETIEKLRTRISELDKQIFGGEDELFNVRKLLYAKIEKDRLLLTPEDIADKKINKEEVVDINPYGEGYNPGNPHLIVDEKK